MVCLRSSLELSRLDCRSESKKQNIPQHLEEKNKVTKYFTHYWTGTACSVARELAQAGHDRLDHAASNQFRKRGARRVRRVRPGDYVYAVNICGGRMMVLGRMRVAEIINQSEAERRLPYEPWEADDHLLAEDGTATLLNFTRKVKPKAARSLRFLTSNGEERSLVFSKANPELLDSQTLRGVRELTEESAELLDRSFPSK